MQLDTVTLHDGTVLRVGDKCLAEIGGRVRVGIITEIAQGTGIYRAWVRVGKRTPQPIPRYRMWRCVSTR